MRTYGGVHIWSRDDGESIAAALDGQACEGPDPAERQGEAITFRPDGLAYYTVSEGAHAAIHRYDSR